MSLFRPNPMLCAFSIMCSTTCGYFFRQTLYASIQQLMFLTGSIFFSKPLDIAILIGFEALGAFIGNSYSTLLAQRFGKKRLIIGLLVTHMVADLATTCGFLSHSWSFLSIGSLCLGISRALFSLSFYLATSPEQNSSFTAKNLALLEIAIGGVCITTPWVFKSISIYAHGACSDLISALCPFLMILPLHLAALYSAQKHLPSLDLASPSAPATTLKNSLKAPFITFKHIASLQNVRPYLILAFGFFLLMYSILHIAPTVITPWGILPWQFSSIVSAHGACILLSAFILMPLAERLYSTQSLLLKSIGILAVGLSLANLFHNILSLAFIYSLLPLSMPVILGRLRAKAPRLAEKKYHMYIMASFGIADTLGNICASILVIGTQLYAPLYAFLPSLLILGGVFFATMAHHSHPALQHSNEPLSHQA